MRRLIVGALVFAVGAAGCAATPEAVQTLTDTTAASATPTEPPVTTATEPPVTTATEPPATTAAEPPATTPAPEPEPPESPAPATPAVDSGDTIRSGPASDASGEASGEPPESNEVSGLTERVIAALEDRSFREFDPSRDADKRKGVILEFFGGIGLWAQYAEGGYALVEWEIRADSYRVEGHDDGSEVTLQFNDPRGRQIIPEGCETCVDTHAVSISVMNVFDPARIAFRVNDPYGVLQSPFPVFNSWTRFGEDEYFD